MTREEYKLGNGIDQIAVVDILKNGEYSYSVGVADSKTDKWVNDNFPLALAEHIDDKYGYVIDGSIEKMSDKKILKLASKIILEDLGEEFSVA